MSRGLAGVLAVLVLILPSVGALPQPAASASPGGASVFPVTRDELDALMAPSAVAPAPVADPREGGSLSPFALPFGLFQNDCGTLEDAPAAREDAVPLASPADCRGTVAWDDDRDAYRFEATRGDVLDVRLAYYDPGSIQTCLTAPSGAALHCSLAVATGGRLRWTANETGTWFLDVVRTRDTWGGGDYRLRLAATPPVTDDDCGAGADGGDSAEAAVAFAAPGACAGEVNHLLDAEDWLAFTVARGEAFHVTLQSGGHPFMCLYAADGKILDCGQWVFPPERGDVRTSELYFEAPADGTYHARVRALGPSSSGPYQLAFTQAARQDDCGTGADASGYAVPDAPLQTPVSCAGVLAFAVADDEEEFAFDGPAALRVTLAVPEVRALLCLLKTDTDAGACAFAEQPGETLSFPYQAAEAGAWELRVWAPFGPRTNLTYELTVEPFTPTPQDDCGTGRDAAEDMTHHPHVDGIDCEGRLLGTEGDYGDLYSFNTTEAGNVTVTATGTPGKLLRVCLTDGVSWWSCAEGDGAASVTLATARPALWHVSVRSFAKSDGDYRLALDVASG